MGLEGLNISQLLHELAAGRPEALDRLMPVVYDELHRMAHVQLYHEQDGHTLNTTALVHETYLRLAGIDQIQWKDRVHFFAVAARLMRRILIDYARARHRDKRGGQAIRVPLVEELAAAPDQAEALLALDDALVRLEAHNARLCRVVECRCFAGMSVEDTAEALHTSAATVKRDWAFARAWLNRALSSAGAGSS